MVGSASPQNVRKWVQWADQPMDQVLLKEVLGSDAEVTFLPTVIDSYLEEDA